LKSRKFIQSINEDGVFYTVLYGSRLMIKHGTKGSIVIPNFWRASSATLQVDGKEKEIIEIPFDGNGYCYEAREVEHCLREGKLQSDLMTWDESISVLKTMDELRKQWGLKYPSDM